MASEIEERRFYSGLGGDCRSGSPLTKRSSSLTNNSTREPYFSLSGLGDGVALWMREACLLGICGDGRVRRGLSQEQLAVDANVNRTYVSGVERATENPTIDV
jgi:Helix-turn-helix